MSHALRPYQAEALAAIMEHLQRVRSTLVVMPTGTGKTQTFSKVAELWPTGRVLILAHREELVFQAADKVAAALGERPDIEMAELRSASGLWGGSRAVIGSVQSVCSRLRHIDPSEFGLVIVDECFPAGTPVDGRPIETIGIGDTITAYDECSGSFRPRRVAHVFRRPAPDRMVRLSAGHHEVTATFNHPFLTRRGWVPAGELVAGDEIGVFDERADLYQLSNAIPADPGSGEGVEAGRSGVLFVGVQADRPVGPVVGPDGSDEPQVCLSQDEGMQPDEAAERPGEGVGVAQGDGLEADGPPRQRHRPDAATGGAGGGYRLGDGVRGQNGDAAEERLPDMLQAGPGQPGVDDRGRDRRALSRLDRPAGAGPQEGGVLGWARLDAVAVHERPGGPGPDRVCPDGFVYNLEVEGDHTYIAAGCVVHNCHHCVPQNVTYWGIIEHMRQNPDCRLLGVTATPDRADRLAMGQVFETVAFEYEIIEAIGDGWLVPIEQQYVTVEGLDFSGCRTTAGDLNQGDLESILAGTPEMVQRLATASADICGGEPTLIFTVSVDHARLTAEWINCHTAHRAEYLHGGTPKEERREKLRDFFLGKYSYLVGCMLFTEGFDAPHIANVVVGRPTTSRALYAQMIGRGTRVLPGTVDGIETAAERLAAIAASLKRRLRVVDFVGNSGRHKLVSTADILAGRHEPAAVLMAAERVKDAGKAVDMRQALDEAAAELERAEIERRRREQEEQRRREEEEHRRKERVKARSSYRAEEVDPFDAADRRAARQGGFQKRKAPTQKMAALLARHGVDPSEMSFDQAARAIADLKASWAGERPSPKQAALLERFGEPTDIPKDKAKALLDLIAARGWKPRRYRLTRDRFFLRLVDGKWAPGVIDPSAGRVLLSARFGSERSCREFVERILEPAEAAGVAA